MLVKQCMTKNVEIGEPNMTLQEVAKKMRDGDFGVLPIGENDRLIGIITDRDIAIRAVAEGMHPQSTRVREILTENLLYCFEDQDLNLVIQNLGDNQVRRLPVLNREKRLVGILSLGDVSKVDESFDEVEAALSRISSKNNPSPEARA